MQKQFLMDHLDYLMEYYFYKEKNSECLQDLFHQLTKCKEKRSWNSILGTKKQPFLLTSRKLGYNKLIFMWSHLSNKWRQMSLGWWNSVLIRRVVFIYLVKGPIVSPYVTCNILYLLINFSSVVCMTDIVICKSSWVNKDVTLAINLP